MKYPSAHADELEDVADRRPLLLIVTILLTVAQGARADSDNGRTQLLPAGLPYRGEIHLDDGQTNRFRIVVPEDAYAIRLAIQEASADLDLIVERSDGELFALSEEDVYNEVLFLTRIDEPPVESGEFVVSVIYQYADLPVGSDAPQDSIRYTLRYEVIEAEATDDLTPGVPIRDVLKPAEGMVKTYRISVGADADELRLDVFDAEGDVDLFVNFREVSVDPLESDYVSQSYLGRESLTIDARSRPPLRPGTYFVTVLDQLEHESAGEFSLVASTSGVPSLLLRDYPEIPIPEEPLERALAATVRIITANGGGSGCIVSADGLILTSWHVVRDNTGSPDESPVVAVSLDHDRPPEELFRGRVLRYSLDRDIALLAIEEGLYGQPLPQGIRLPHFEFGDPGSLRFGDRLWFVGYPDVGGTGSRPSITLTSGIVSGFERTGFGRLVKTDGEINEGNSGGAALNERFELVGLPTRVVGQDAGQIAYIHPVSVMPSSWWRLIGR